MQKLCSPDSKTALITGGSSGIGYSIAKSVLNTSNVIITARNEEKLSAAVKELQSSNKSGHSVDYRVMDVTSESDVSEKVDDIISSFGDIDILINCAGVGGGGITMEIPLHEFVNILETNLIGVFIVTKTILNKSAMLKKHWGRIINISSTGGKQGVMYAAAYSSSKHGVIGFTKSLGLELAKSGVTVNAICPGFVETAMAEKARRGYAAIWKCSEDDAKHRIEARIPSGRYVNPAEVGSMTSFLVSDEASSIIAQAINVCGGLGNY